MQCYSKGENRQSTAVRLWLISIFIHLSGTASFSQSWTDVWSLRYISLPFNEAKQQRLVWFHADAAYGVKRGASVYAVNPAFEKLDGSWGAAVYGISLPVVYSHAWKGSLWQSTLIGTGRLNSDLKDISKDDFQAGCVNIHSIQRKPNLKYKFGFYFNTEYDQFFIIPLAGVEWKGSERFLINALLPSYFISEYQLFPLKMHAGIVFRSFTKSFRFADRSYLTMHENYTALFTDFYFARSIVLNAECGYVFLRKYKSGINIPERSEQELTAEPGLMFRLALIYRIRKD
jgi:hypothetical protein